MAKLPSMYNPNNYENSIFPIDNLYKIQSLGPIPASTLVPVPRIQYSITTDYAQIEHLSVSMSQSDTPDFALINVLVISDSIRYLVFRHNGYIGAVQNVAQFQNVSLSLNVTCKKNDIIYVEVMNTHAIAKTCNIYMFIRGYNL